MWIGLHFISYSMGRISTPYLAVTFEYRGLLTEAEGSAVLLKAAAAAVLVAFAVTLFSSISEPASILVITSVNNHPSSLCVAILDFHAWI